MTKKTALLSLLKELLIGFCLGTANIIPGVSGGTFLLIFQIYERVFSILNRVNKTTLIGFFACVIPLVFKSGRAHSLAVLMGFLKKNDFIFLFKLIVGAGVAIVCLSSLMKYLIVHHFSVTYALFFGLILVSIIIPVKMLREKKVSLIFFILLGAISTIYVSASVNPYDKVKMKSEVYQKQYLKHQDIKTSEKNIELRNEKKTTRLSFTGKYTIEEYAYAAACGAVAISAMVLPGISGSLVLILMGEYFEVVSAIAGLRTLNLDYAAFLGCFLVGIVFGGLLFVRLFSVVLKRYYNAAMAFLMGLMMGSLYALWPFKKTIVMAQQYIKKEGVITIAHNIKVYTNLNVAPQIGPEFFVALGSFFIGAIIMLFFVNKEMKH